MSFRSEIQDLTTLMQHFAILIGLSNPEFRGGISNSRFFQRSHSYK